MPSKSYWTCDNCGKSQESCYEDIEAVGIPFCAECDEDMSFDFEEWEETFHGKKKE